MSEARRITEASGSPYPGLATMTLLLTGDVMTGRGIDQVLPYSVDPRLYESFVRDARVYVRIAEERNGPIPADIGYDYIWGDALEELKRAVPDACIINLETAVTTSDAYWPEKGIHYRMHPGNIGVLTAAGIDVCVLGNNHVMDWGHSGLRETLAVLHDAGVATAGAGEDFQGAAAPAVLGTRAGRLLIFSYACTSSGVPEAWAAGEGRAGVNLLPTLGVAGAEWVTEQVLPHRRPGDRVVVSVHWGGNWGYDVPAAQREFAHSLVDAGAADIVHGHSSHHPKGIEVHGGRLILYGAGDFLNDYEGIEGHERFRSDLAVMYFPTLDAGGVLSSLEMAPLQTRRFRLLRPADMDVQWMAQTLDRESRRWGCQVEHTASGRLTLHWNQ